MHVQRIDDSIPLHLGTGGVPCPVCGKPAGEFCCGGEIAAYPGPGGGAS